MPDMFPGGPRDRVETLFEVIVGLAVLPFYLVGILICLAIMVGAIQVILG